MKIFYVILVITFLVACSAKKDETQDLAYAIASEGEIVDTTDTLKSGVKTELDGLRIDAVDTFVKLVDTFMQKKTN